MPANIEIPHTGSKTVDWAVHSASLNVLAKIATFFLAISIPVLAWTLTEVWNTNKMETKEAIKELKDAALLRNSNNDRRLDLIASAIIDMKLLQHDLETLKIVVSKGFDDQGRRIDKGEKDIESIRKEMYDRYVPPGTAGARAR